MKSTFIYRTKRIVTGVLVTLGFIQALVADDGALPTSEVIGDKQRSAINQLFPNARFFVTNGVAQVKTRTRYAYVPRHAKVDNVSLSDTKVEVPEDSDFMVSFHIRPGPYHEPRALPGSPHFRRDAPGTNQICSASALVEFPASNLYMVVDIAFGGNCDVSKLQKVYDSLLAGLKQRFGEPWRGDPGQGLPPHQGAEKNSNKN
jgi:hypothetical protein